MPSTGRRYVHIAVGVLQNDRGEVLICQRPPHKLYPGEWEFPGGKVEAGEGVEQALRRELREELGIEVRECRPLIRLRHVYPELSVDLDTWLVSRYAGDVRSTEHPAEAWALPRDLPKWPLLAADRPIVNALRLPAHCIFTPTEAQPEALAARAAGLPRGLLRLRLPRLGEADYAKAARDLTGPLTALGHTVVLDREPGAVAALGAGGFHATSARLRALRERPVATDAWFGASCHSVEDLDRARALGADYAVLGPVRPTATHPEAAPLGWERFREWATHAGLPVYAIGGVGPGDLPMAWAHGAQGAAGIGAYWGLRPS